MQGIILCGGRGERLMPMTAKTPASLLRICCKEVLLYNIELLKNAGVDRITLALDYAANQIKEFVSKLSNENIIIDFSEISYGETAAALSFAVDRNEENVIVLNGNFIYDGSLLPLIDFHNDKKALCTVLLGNKDDKDAQHYVGLDENCKVTSLVTNPSKAICGCNSYLEGIFVLNTHIFDLYPFTAGSDFIRHILPQFIENNENFYGFESETYCKSIITPQGFLDCQGYLLDKQMPEYLSETETNFGGCTISAPVRIGKNVTVESGTIIENGSVIDDGAVIGSKCRISGSYVGKNAVISRGCELEKTVMCQNASLNRSVQCEEYAVLGENSSIGEFSRLCSDTAVWADKKIYPNTTVSNNVIKYNASIPHIDENGDFILSDLNLDPSKAVIVGQAIGTALNVGDLVVIGHSERKNSDIISRCVEVGLVCSGVNVCNLGKCTLPQLIFALSKNKGRLCIFSDLLNHSKLTILAGGGVTIDRKTEIDFETALVKRSLRSVSANDICKPYKLDGYKFFYKEYLSGLLPNAFNNLNVEIRTNSNMIAEIADEIFPKRNNIDGEKIVFNVSYDGKKCTAYTDKIGNVSWDKLVCLCCDHAFEKELPVSLPYTFSTAADVIAEEKNGRLYRFFNSPFDDSDKIAREKAISIHNLFIADGLMLAVRICKILCAKNKTLTDALRNIPDIFMSERFITTDLDSKKIAGAFDYDMRRPNEGIAINKKTSRTIIRPLKNGGGINVFVEASNWETAAALCDEINEKVKKLESGINF